MIVQFSIKDLVLLLIITLLGIICSVTFNVPLVIGFSPGLLFLFNICMGKGVPFLQLFKISLKGIRQTKEVIWILLLVSIILPIWDKSGTISQLISISLNTLSVHHFLFFSFLLTMLLSLILGTSVGTLSAIGIPLMSAANVLGLPMEMTAGALISGAFVGDRTSPLSSSHQLLSHTIEVPVYKQIRNMLPTTLIAVIFCFTFYSFLDFRMIEPNKVLFSNFPIEKISPLALTPPLVLLAMVMLRLKIRYAFIASIGVGLFVSIYFSVSLNDILVSAWKGSEHVGGGVKNMFMLILFIAMAGMYNGIVEEYRLIQPLVNKLVKGSTSLFGNTWKLTVTTLCISIIACNQTLPIILTGRAFLPHWKTKINDEELSRVMGDSTMLFAGMIPWSMLAIMCSTIIGVSVIQYLPYALFLWILPFLTICLSLFKSKMKKRLLKFEEGI